MPVDFLLHKEALFANVAEVDLVGAARALIPEKHLREALCFFKVWRHRLHIEPAFLNLA